MTPDFIATIAILSILGTYVILDGYHKKSNDDIINFDEDDNNNDDEIVIYLNSPKRKKLKTLKLSNKTNFDKYVDDLETQMKNEDQELEEILRSITQKRGGERTKIKRNKKKKTVKIKKTK